MKKTSSHASTTPQHDGFTVYAPLVLLSVCILLQGGFFPSGILFAVIIGAALCFFKKCILQIRYIPFLAFSLLFFVCSLQNGYNAENAAKGLLPLGVLLFGLLLPDSEKERKAITDKLTVFSAFIATIAIIRCIFSSLTHLTLVRITFPFGYSNTSGIFFAVMLILSLGHKSKLIRYSSVIFASALILTQSVAAIGLCFCALLILRKNLKFAVLSLAFVLIFAIAFHSRIYQSLGTFTERFVQIYDGIRCITDNPLFGIGAGEWETRKHIWQSGFYSASILHSSFVGIGVSCGISGLLIFLCSAVFLLRDFAKYDLKNKLCVSILLIHSLIDITFSFVAVGMLVLLLTTESKEAAVIKNNRLQSVVKIIFLLSAVLISAFISFNLILASNLCTKLSTHSYGEICEMYESNSLYSKSSEARAAYLSSLCVLSKYDEALRIYEKTEYPTTEEIIIVEAYIGGILGKALEHQPYNQHLYDYAATQDNAEISEISANSKAYAVEHLSFFGKLLYKFQ